MAVSVGVVVTLAACQDSGAKNRAAAIGDADVGATLIGRYGCGSCHEIPGIENARGLVGPPLDHMGRRIYLAGMLPNTPANMVQWLRDPQAIVPGNAMPDMGLSRREAADIAAYLFKLD
nr:c-type cytochrome [Aurantimonas marina]